MRAGGREVEKDLLIPSLFIPSLCWTGMGAGQNRTNQMMGFSVLSSGDYFIVRGV